MTDHTILVVEDDVVQIRQIARILRSEGYTILQASMGKEALCILKKEQVDMILTDRRMPDMGGDALLGHVRLRYPEIPIAIVTAYPEGVESLEPDGLLEKPFKGHQLMELVQMLSADKSD